MSPEDSVDLTPGDVWSEAQIAVVRDLTVRVFRAERAVARVEVLHVPSHGYCVVCDRDRDVETLGNNPECQHQQSFCRECDYAWPCRTRRALDGTD